jgi:Tol biopolymer transport system component
VFDVVDDWDSIILPTWSPDEKYIAYRNNGSLRILSLVTDEMFEPQARPSIGPRFVWSPDSQRIAVVVSKHEDFAIDSEEHVHIFDVRNGTYERLLSEESVP